MWFRKKREIEPEPEEEPPTVYRKGYSCGVDWHLQTDKNDGICRHCGDTARPCVLKGHWWDSGYFVPQFMIDGFHRWIE